MTLAQLNLSIVGPEIVVSVMACVILIVDLYCKSPRRAGPIYPLALITLMAGAVLSFGQWDQPSALALNGLVIGDPVAAILKAATCLGVAGVLLYSRDYAQARGLWRGEYLVLALFGAVGMMTMIGANHLLTIYVGLELLALCLYAMIGMQRDSVRAAEAAMKYFILGALASGVLLYGMSLLYGLTGSLALPAISAASASLTLDSLPLLVAIALIVAGLLFKLGAVPFHMWVPDVYDGSATATTLYLSAVPKLAAFAILLRLLGVGLGDWLTVWQDMLAVAAVLSIALGNIIAIAQHNIKRMLAYSTISHMGFLLLGFLGGNVHGYSAALSYVVIYATVTLGAFGIILVLSDSEFESDTLDDFKGLNQRHPWLAFLMLIVMFSLAGIPPTAGFFAKLLVLQSALESGFVGTVVFAVLLAVVGAFYYLRVVKLMYFDSLDDTVTSPEGEPGPTPRRSLLWVLSANILLLLGITPWVGSLVDWLSTALNDFGPI